MRPNFPSRDQLSAMSVQQLRNLDIADADEEALVQEILNSKLVNLPPENPIKRSDIPDIKSPEEEAKYQEIINERTEAMKPSIPSEGKTFVTDDVKIPGPTVMSPMVETVPEKRFCEYCDSKGYRHKKDCTRPK